MLALVALCFSLLCSAVLGLPFTERDVVNPHITNPHQGTVWVVGKKEVVTWETDDLPPESQITNPQGRVILGFQENGSLNLQLDNPLASGFDIFDGNVTITVPDVPPRDDYIIVLMGDSGNASPAFAITSIQGGSSSSSTSSPSVTSTGNHNTSAPNGNDPSKPNSTDPPSSSTTPSDNSPPFTGSTITGGASPSSSGGVKTAPGPVSLPSSLTLSSNSNSPSQSSSSITNTGSAAAASTSTSAAWPVYSTNLWSVLVASLAITLLI